MRTPALIWLPHNLHQQCTQDAAHWYPLETGGVLMGYWNGKNAVITGLVEAGPSAVRETHNFEPDHAWQLAKIAERFKASEGRETYLGDWHTHPKAASGQLSGLDRQVLRSILEKPAARTPRPIMMILFGAGDEWDAAAWLCSRRSWCRGPSITAMKHRIW